MSAHFNPQGWNCKHETFCKQDESWNATFDSNVVNSEILSEGSTHCLCILQCVGSDSGLIFSGIHLSSGRGQIDYF